jgi:hypothetical protein
MMEVALSVFLTGRNVFTEIWFIGNFREAPPVLAAVALPPPSSATAGTSLTANPREPEVSNKGISFQLL